MLPVAPEPFPNFTGRDRPARSWLYDPRARHIAALHRVRPVMQNGIPHEPYCRQERIAMGPEFLFEGTSPVQCFEQRNEEPFRRVGVLGSVAKPVVCLGVATYKPVSRDGPDGR